MSKLDNLAAKNGVRMKEKTEVERITELEQIIAEQDEALMELAELIAGGDSHE